MIWGKLYQNSNKMEVDICTSENGLAVLFPMRKPKKYIIRVKFTELQRELSYTQSRYTKQI